MARDDDGGFGIGVLLGGVAGFIAGAWLASGPGRSQVERLRERTVELTSRGAEQAREALNNPEHPLNRAVQDGLSAARQRRGELERLDSAAAAAETGGGITEMPQQGA